MSTVSREENETAPRPNTIRRRPVPVETPMSAPASAPSIVVRSVARNSAPPSTATHRTVIVNPIEAAREERKRRRDARRSFRESEDFLGVQGVNPRTGRKDPSGATSITADTLVTRLTVGGSLDLGGSVDMGSLDLGSVGTGVRIRVEERKQEVRELRGRYVRAKERFKEEVRVIKRERRERKFGINTGRREAQISEAGVKRRDKEAKWMLSENGWNSVFSPDPTPVVEWDVKGNGNAGWKGAQDGYFDVLKPRHMSIIPESPGAGEEREVISGIRDVKGAEDVKIGFEEFRRRCRRHRRSFK